MHAIEPCDCPSSATKQAMQEERLDAHISVGSAVGGPDQHNVRAPNMHGAAPRFGRSRTTERQQF
eukprot:363671-Chlamydomonas_euryale.AAC.7